MAISPSNTHASHESQRLRYGDLEAATVRLLEQIASGGAKVDANAEAGVYTAATWPKEFSGQQPATW